MGKKLNIITRGIIKENPVLVLLLGTCPTLATTSSAFNGLGMGVSATVVLICSNIVISLLRNIIPDKVRIPCYIVVIAGFVTVVQLMLQAFVPSLYASLGLFIPLIVVNCIILGRAEMFASKNGIVDSALDGIGMGLGFTLALGLMGSIREFFGAGTLLGFPITQGKIDPMGIFNLAPGGFFVFAILIALVNIIVKDKTKLNREFGCAEARLLEADRRVEEKAKAKAKADAEKAVLEESKAEVARAKAEGQVKASSDKATIKAQTHNETSKAAATNMAMAKGIEQEQTAEKMARAEADRAEAGREDK